MLLERNVMLVTLSVFGQVMPRSICVLDSKGIVDSLFVVFVFATELFSDISAIELLSVLFGVVSIDSEIVSVMRVGVKKSLNRCDPVVSVVVVGVVTVVVVDSAVVVVLVVLVVISCVVSVSSSASSSSSAIGAAMVVAFVVVVLRLRFFVVDDIWGGVGGLFNSVAVDNSVVAGNSGIGGPNVGGASGDDDGTGASKKDEDFSVVVGDGVANQGNSCVRASSVTSVNSVVGVVVVVEVVVLVVVVVEVVVVVVLELVVLVMGVVDSVVVFNLVDRDRGGFLVVTVSVSIVDCVVFRVLSSHSDSASSTHGGLIALYNIPSSQTPVFGTPFSQLM